MAKKYAPWLSAVAGSIVLACVGCADEDSTSGELSSTEATIAALRASGTAAQSVAAACFETFKTCQASAADGDTTCREQLKACLPERAPRAPGCGDKADGGTRADAGVAPTPPATDAGRPARADGGEREGRAPSSDGGLRGGDGGDRPDRDGDDEDRDGDRDRDDRGRRGDRRACGDDHMPHGAVGGCRDSAAGSMQGGMSGESARAAHQACVAHAFDDKLTKLCSRATQLCAQQGAPEDVCTRINSACSALESDAGI